MSARLRLSAFVSHLPFTAGYNLPKTPKSARLCRLLPKGRKNDKAVAQVLGNAVDEHLRSQFSLARVDGRTLARELRYLIKRLRAVTQHATVESGHLGLSVFLLDYLSTSVATRDSSNTFGSPLAAPSVRTSAIVVRALMALGLSSVLSVNLADHLRFLDFQFQVCHVRYSFLS